MSNITIDTTAPDPHLNELEYLYSIKMDCRARLKHGLKRFENEPDHIFKERLENWDSGIREFIRAVERQIEAVS